MENFPSLAEIVASPAIAVAVVLLVGNTVQATFGWPKKWVGLVLAAILVIGGNVVLGTTPQGLANSALTALLVWVAAMGGTHAVTSYLGWRERPAGVKVARGRSWWAEW